MQLALYAPRFGYYSGPVQKFGAQGDFITAPELGSLFAQCVAQQCEQILGSINATTILEIGAGSGQLACDLLKTFDQANVLIEQYLILELSADLRATQQQKLQQQCPELFDRVTWLDQLPTAFSGVIVANEVLDAMPVTRFRWHNNILQEHYVQLDANDKLQHFYNEPSQQLADAFADLDLATHLGSCELPYESEINLWLAPWLRSLNDCLTQGAILLFDYGFGRREFYHPQRNTGTLMCHAKHQTNHDPLHNPGLQDITAHVDFTAVAESAYNTGLNVAGYTNLASFLINCGIVGMLDHSIQQNREIQFLTSPAEMGELFKAICLTKEIDLALIGFSSYDKLHSL